MAAGFCLQDKLDDLPVFGGGIICFGDCDVDYKLAGGEGSDGESGGELEVRIRTGKGKLK
jgi:hypothetical protein